MSGKYKMRSVVRQTGFSPALLRAWEQRYNLLEPERTDSGHRLYSERDVEILRAVKNQLAAGRSIGEIARQGVDALITTKVSEATRVPADARDLTDALVAGAVELDSAKIERALDRAFMLVSPPLVIHEVIQPAARRIGELWAAGVCTVAGEHLFSAFAIKRLRHLLEVSNVRAGAAAKTLTACFPDELHELGAVALSYMLVQAGASVTCLGAALPFDDLRRACLQLKPRAVFLSVTRSKIYEQYRDDLAALVPELRTDLLVVGGPGVTPGDDVLVEAGVKIIPPEAIQIEILAKLLAPLR